jgi:hypothetical protein
MSRLAAEIDHLYQVPLAGFTAERNALAKRAGGNAAEIRALPKPTLAAWAINQVYWRQRPVYTQLLERAEDLRATHDATLRGRRTDLRGASKAHEESVEAALKATLALLAADGHPATDTTRQAIATTLRSLPGDEPAGRLSRQLQPRGFEVLAAAASPGRVRPAPAPAKPRRDAPGDRGKDQAARAAAAARVAEAREAVAAAARSAGQAEQLVRREEFEAARASRDAEKAQRRVKEAEDGVRQAEADLDEARRAAATADKASATAQARAEKAADELTAAKAREERARKQLDALT